MWRDARDVGEDERVEGDLCIVGTGPAGLALASEMAGRAERVIVLESGGLELEPATQALADGEATPPQEPLIRTRRRQFGGTTHAWDSGVLGQGAGFRGGPLDRIDFERRGWVPYSGWPFGRETLDPYYERAQRLCGFGPYRYEGAAWEDERARRFPVDTLGMLTDVWQYGTQRTFTESLRQRLERAPNISVFLHANVVEIETNEAGSAVSALRVARLGGGGFRVRARAFILAMGGIENARLLLLSTGRRPAGIGNEHDLVGRFFMEHQYLHGGTLVPASPSLLDQAALYDVRRVGEAQVMGKLCFTDETLRRERLLNVSAALLPRHRWYRRMRQEPLDAFGTLARSARRLRVPAAAGRHLRTALAGADWITVSLARKASGRRLFRDLQPGPDMLTGGGWSAAPGNSRRFHVFEVILHSEQAPDRENRIVLDDTRDELGCRKARLHWHWGEEDIDSVRRAQVLLARALAQGGVGRYVAHERDGRPELVGSGLHHHIGTTRMHDDPSQGVVDAECRVHGVGNLFVAGCSCFPTGGYINPTLSIVALSIRLADHVQRVLAGSGLVPAGEAGQPGASA